MIRFSYSYHKFQDILLLHERDGVLENFDERLWVASVDTVTVYKTGEMVFRFKNKMEIKHLKK